MKKIIVLKEFKKRYVFLRLAVILAENKALHLFTFSFGWHKFSQGFNRYGFEFTLQPPQIVREGNKLIGIHYQKESAVKVVNLRTESKNESV